MKIILQKLENYYFSLFEYSKNNWLGTAITIFGKRKDIRASMMVTDLKLSDEIIHDFYFAPSVIEDGIFP